MSAHPSSPGEGRGTERDRPGVPRGGGSARTPRERVLAELADVQVAHEELRVAEEEMRVQREHITALLLQHDAEREFDSSRSRDRDDDVDPGLALDGLRRLDREIEPSSGRPRRAVVAAAQEHGPSADQQGARRLPHRWPPLVR